MTTQNINGHYPLVPATEYLNVLERYKDLPNIRPEGKTSTIEKNKPKENFWKTLFSVKTLINVWVPTVMTVGGTLGGAIIGAKYNTPPDYKHRPKGSIEKPIEQDATNKMTYVFSNPNDDNVQFAVIGKKDELPKAFWITNNSLGFKEIYMATQAEQVVLQKE